MWAEGLIVSLVVVVGRLDGDSLTSTFCALNIRTRLKAQQHSAVFRATFNVRDGTFALAMATIVGECVRSCMTTTMMEAECY